MRLYWPIGVGLAVASATLLAAACTVVGNLGAQAATDPTAALAERGGSLSNRPAGNPDKNAYFGELHVHTKTSVDSFLRRNMLTMSDAYRFAKGAKVTVAGGETVQLTRPLDFMALTDHSESYQTYDLCVEGSGPASQTEGCKALKSDEDVQANIGLQTMRKLGPPRSLENCGGDPKNCEEAVKRVWGTVRRLAAENYEPGKFTSFIGYEYSGGVVGSNESGGHMHRNVLFADENVPDTVFTALDGNRNFMLWKWLEDRCVAPCDVMAIPHNTNLSWGFGFALETVEQQPYKDEDWTRRARYERLAEIYQIKGNSECGVGFGTTDEQCGFEQRLPPCAKKGDSICVMEGSFVRGALKNGLNLRSVLGFNPFKLGFVAGTDSHNAIPGATKESAYVGSIGIGDGNPTVRLNRQIHRSPGGLTGIWATDNTRPALFSSMKARETFATSGTRIRVRMFGGFGLPMDLADRSDFVARGYRLGVPMGGDLKPGKGAPRFLLWAGYDPESARLQRIQIVKGWYAPNGVSEAIYDVACSDGLKPDPKTHRCPDNGAQVSLKDCSFSQDKGAAALATVWEDPDFDPRRPAFYYVRVFENPTCRWSAWDSIRLGKEPPPIPSPIMQERAWSSPIWYDPA